MSITKIYKCKYCGKEFDNRHALAGHTRGCLLNPNRSTNNTIKATLIFVEKHRPKIYKFVCEKCGKEFDKEMSEQRYNNVKNHPKFCCRSCANSHIVTEEHKQKTSQSVKSFFQEHPVTTEPKTYLCKYCGNPFTMNTKRDTNGRKYCSYKCRENWIEENVKPKLGGYRKGSGRGKHGWYKGIYCDSSWELAFVIYHLEHNINIKRCKNPRKYIFEGKEFKYYPDFEINNKIYEIKGYSTKRWEAKISQNSDIIVLMKEDMQKYLDYCIKKYGNNFIYLYDK